ncbi:MAG: pilus assembly protein [Elioraea sp.]|nr:pilus assembly protein [Elioraea sp.]MDW8444271.1 pilus assembly protein [Acetobacteraceae bacterium]
MCVSKRRAGGLLPARRDTDSGGTAVGFAVVAPVLLMLVFGCIDLARYAFTVVSLREAAAIAVRAAAVGRAEAEAARTAREHAPFVPSQAQFTVQCHRLTVSGGVTTETPIPCATPIDPTGLRRARVTVATDFRFLLPYLPGGVLRVEQRTEVTS